MRNESIPSQPVSGSVPSPVTYACDFCGAEVCTADDWSDIAGGFLCTACVEHQLQLRIVQ